MRIEEVLTKHSIVGLAGNRSTAKSSLVLSHLLQLKQRHKDLHVAVFGINEELHKHLQDKGLTIIKSKMDILDLQFKDTVIFIDEMAMFFDTKTKNKQLDKLSRFFDRIEHHNCKIIMGTAREGYFNKFMCSRTTCFLVKEVEYDALVNGTWLKEHVKSITSSSDYRLETPKDSYFVVSNKRGEVTTRHTFSYDPSIDTKKDNKNLFNTKVKKGDKKSDR